MSRRLAVVAALACALPVLAQDPKADPDSDPKRWLSVKKWVATVDVLANGSREKQVPDGSLTRAWWRTGWGGKATLEPDEKGGGTAFVLLKGKFEPDHVNANEELYEQGPPDDERKRPWTRTAFRTTSAKPEDELELSVTLDLEKGTYQLLLPGCMVTAEVHVQGSANEGTTFPSAFSPPVPLFHEKIQGLEDEHFPRMKLPARGLRVVGVGRFNYRPTAGAEVLGFADDPATATVHLSMQPDGREAVELIVSPKSYDTWRPAPSEKEDEHGSAIDVTVKLVKPEGTKPRTLVRRLKYVLSGVSREKGVCANYPRSGQREPDLRIDAKNAPAGLHVDPGGLEATTDFGEYPEQTIRLLAYDGGAYGQLRVVAELSDGSSVVGHLEGDRGALDVTIPKDEDDNHIADGWEPALAKGKSASWDEDPNPEGTHAPGDGIPLYEEYRGFFVVEEGRRKFKRLDPRTKETFFLDVDGAKAFNATAWTRMTRGSIAYEVDGETVNGGNPGADVDFPREKRLVNFNAGYGKGRGKVAKFVHCDLNPGIDYAQGDPKGGGSDDRSVMGSKRDAPDGEFYLFMFPTHLRRKVIDDFVLWALKGAATQWSTHDAGRLFRDAGVSEAEVKQAYDKATADPAIVHAAAKRYAELVILHEMAHAHDVSGHRPTSENEEAGHGFITCPMYYWSGHDNRLATIVELLRPEASAACYRMSRLCKSSDPPPADSSPDQGRCYDCFSQLKFK